MAGDDSKSMAGSKSNLVGASSKSNLLGSKGNLLRNSFNNLKGSIKNLTGAGKSQVNNAATAAEDEVALPKFENTYRTKPEKKLQSAPLQKVVDAILAKHLTNVTYSAEKIPELTKVIANEILAGVKGLEYDRYKFVVDVSIGEFKGQGIRVASRCLWDVSTDTYASGSFKNATIFAVAMVFGTYFE